MRLYAGLVSGTASAVSKAAGVMITSAVSEEADIVITSAVSRAADVIRIFLRKDDRER